MTVREQLPLVHEPVGRRVMPHPVVLAPMPETLRVPLWNERPPGYRVFKRSLDLAITIPLFLLTLPLQLVIAGLIRLDSPGPALFRQTRLTLDGRRFTFLKFRTMYVDARERFPQLYNYAEIVEQDGGVPLKGDADPRVTRMGAWLRRTSLDELPNLWHVVTGEMSLVGPRPQIPELLPCYAPEQRQIFQVRAGISGLAQVQGRNRLTVAQSIELDYQYVQQAGIWLDLSIVCRTIAMVFACRDAF